MFATTVLPAMALDLTSLHDEILVDAQRRSGEGADRIHLRAQRSGDVERRIALLPRGGTDVPQALVGGYP